MLLLLLTSYANAKEIYAVKIEGVITGYTYKYIKQSLNEASKNDGVLMIKLDTPGGLLESTRDIVQLLLESDTPVITFVSPQGARAGSAGTFITLASHHAAMAEGTNIGAAHPVNVTGKDLEGHMAKKVENDTIAFIRSIAQKRERNVTAAIDTVRKSTSFTAEEALEKKLIDAVANSDREIAEKFGYSPDITYLKATPMQRVAFFLSDPNILIMLLFVGILAIVLEFKMPGTFVFAAIGIAAILMFLMGINIIPINSLALLLIIGGIGLLGAEIFVPSFGLLTIAATACLGGGMYLLFSREGNMGISISLWLIGIMLGVVLSIVLTIGRLVFKDFKKKPETGVSSLVSKKGKVISWEGLSGKVFVYGEIWNAKSNEPLEKDEKIIILDVVGMEVTVEKDNE
jgi:membrane-bound serine protease (ClpP class)